MKNVLTLCVVLLQMTILNAQSVVGNGVEMADTFRQSGKIYVVVSVVVIIFAGLIFYMFSIDNKLKKLEKEIKNKN